MFRLLRPISSTLVLASLALVVPTARAAIIISEVHPSGSGNAAYGADFFEVTNTGASAVDITGWKMDDNSNSFASSVAIRGVTSISPGQSIILLEGDATGSNDAAIRSSFLSAWFGANAPASLVVGGYGGSGVGLSTAGDAVNLFDAAGNRVTGVAFGAATTGVTFDNAAGLGSTTLPLPILTTLSSAGVNGAFQSPSLETGSPGVVPEPGTAMLLGLGLLALASGSKSRAR
ncbi:MAG: lamin tail domain-containing protein [Myxococcota bacterium]